MPKVWRWMVQPSPTHLPPPAQWEITFNFIGEQQVPNNFHTELLFCPKTSKITFENAKILEMDGSSLPPPLPPPPAQ